MKIRYSFPSKNYDHFLPLAERESQWGLYLTAAGWDILRPGDSCKFEGRPHIYRLNFDQGRILHEYILLYAYEGKATFRSEVTPNREIPEGAFVLLHPGIWHTYKPDQTIGWTNIWLTLNGSLLHDYQQRGIIRPENPILQLPDKRRKEAADLLWEIVNDVRQHPLCNDPRYAGKLLLLLTTLFSTEEKPVLDGVLPDSPQAAVQKAQDIIWNWGYREIDVAFIAQNIGKTRRTLERYFREILHCSVRDEIHRCRIIRACTILRQTRIKISQTAYMAGFTGVGQMNRVFMRYLKKTPREIRAEKQK
ncbi:MAG: AraC family transcriptional regulator [Planctomycetia bacterium]|nr:AraC family transcriptional regulator [Planctomycetia bacterium]